MASQVKQSSEIFSRDLLPSYADIQFLASLKQSYDAKADVPESLDNLATTFSKFAQTQKRYLQVRMLDRAGVELVRINWNGIQAERVTGKELQDKAKRDYFQQSLDLAPGETYISNLNLNREYGKIERPLTPVIRIVTPVRLLRISYFR